MIKIKVEADCGHSPRKEFIRDFNIAFAKGNGEFILNSVKENIKWNMYGDFELNGKAAFQKEIEKMLEYPRPKELVIDSIITHGRDASASGRIVMDENTYAFCDVYKFQNTTKNTLVDLKSFVIKI